MKKAAKIIVVIGILVTLTTSVLTGIKKIRDSKNISEVAKKYLNLEMSDYYFDRDNCMKAAQEIVDNEEITGMTVKQIAKEIYTHAYVYYKFDKLPQFVKDLSIAKKAYNSAANGVDLEDNGDSLKRRVAYTCIWLLK